MIGFSQWLLLMLFGLVPLATILIILRELYDRHPAAVPRLWCMLLTVIGWAIVLFLAVITAGMLGFSFGYVLVAMGMVILIQAIISRRAEDAELLEWLTTSVVSGGSSIPDAFERFAGTRVNSMSRRCRDFAYRIRSGVRPSIAAKKSRMPLSVGALLTLDDGRVTPASMESSELDEVSQFGSIASWPLGNQVAYLAGLVLMILMLPIAFVFVITFILPTLDVMADEFGMSKNFGLVLLTEHRREIDVSCVFVFTLVVFFFGLVMVCFFWPTRWLLRITPVYGGWARSRGQYHGLRAFAAGLRSGRPLVETAQATALLTRSRWVRSRACSTQQRLESGQGIASALHGGGFVSAAEAKWIAAGEATGRLAQTLEAIAESSRRRFELLWQIRLSWLIPLTVVVLGGCVLFLFFAVLGSLTEIIYGLT